MDVTRQIHAASAFSDRTDLTPGGRYTLCQMTVGPGGESGQLPRKERRAVPRIDHGDFDTVLEYDERSQYAALAFVGPKAGVPADRGDWLMTLNGPDWSTVQVCLIGSGSDFPEAASAITASEIALSQVGYRYQRTPVDAHLTAAWEIETA